MQVSLFTFDWTMDTVYIVCALVGGTVLVFQILLMLLGMGDGHGDFDVDSDPHPDVHGHGEASFSVLSIRALAAFLTFFGLAGWGALNAGWSQTASIAAAGAAGTALMFAVAGLMYLQLKLQSQGNVDPRNAIGKHARVYLRVPAGDSGMGKITVSVQGRSVEFSAVTKGGELPTGSTVKVLRMTTPDTFEVTALKEE